MLKLHARAQQPDLENANNENKNGEQIADGGSHAKIQTRKGGFIHQGQDKVSQVERITAIGNQQVGSVGIQAANGEEHKQKHQCWAKKRKGHISKALKGICPIYFSSFVKMVRNRLK